ncbi:hypothetical protein ACOMHN_053805 [Nucella lapillus]
MRTNSDIRVSQWPGKSKYFSISMRPLKDLTETDFFEISHTAYSFKWSRTCPVKRLMLCEAKENLVDGIYIRFRTDGNVFNLHQLLARTKTIAELITELLFADDYAFLAHIQEALQYIVDCFTEAAKASSA